MLIPVRLVKFQALRDWDCFDTNTDKVSARGNPRIRHADFSNWKDHDSYSKSFDRLLRDLKAEGSTRLVNP